MVRRRSGTGLCSLALSIGLLLATAAIANVDPARFEDPERAARYAVLIKELRCLVCQNQNLADSNAELAQDLRHQVSSMIKDGKSDAQIVEFMVQRYGDFVLYRPPFKAKTLVLWLGPALLLLVAILVGWRALQRGRVSADLSAPDPGREKARRLLDAGDEKGGPPC
ncbi:MAG: cytochrome c-type biogenesis protein CcmH [Gammaproteobacteria bacterium]|nr:cytochrome c-type biogenesis protein CcmH [Gammaproteobacteria bacterium]